MTPATYTGFSHKPDDFRCHSCLGVFDRGRTMVSFQGMIGPPPDGVWLCLDCHDEWREIVVDEWKKWDAKVARDKSVKRALNILRLSLIHI